MIDPEKWLVPVSEAEPSGPNLEYDPEFQALERAQAGRPEQVIGDAVKPGEDPDWSDVQRRAEALLDRTRDLRVAIPLTFAVLKTDGFAGLAAGLALVSGLLERQWPTVHPQLDAEDNDDPTFRANSLVSLASADGLLKLLRVEPVVQSKAIGRFNLRDLRVAAGRQPPPAGTEPPQQVQIDAAFQDAKVPELQASFAAIGAALDSVAAMDRVLVDKLGPQAPDFKPLTVDLAEIRRVLNEKLAARGAAPGESGDAATPATPAGAPPAAPPGGGRIGSREDVARTLDQLCDYYRQHEPSSPIPLLLQRARRLIGKDFLEIIRDLAPSGVAETESIGGVEKSGG